MGAALCQDQTKDFVKLKMRFSWNMFFGRPPQIGGLLILITINIFHKNARVIRKMHLKFENICNVIINYWNRKEYLNRVDYTAL